MMTPGLRAAKGKCNQLHQTNQKNSERALTKTNQSCEDLQTYSKAAIKRT